MKRFLSIILAAVMVIALLPSAFAATDAETEKTVYKYEFTLAGAGEEVTAEEIDNEFIGNTKRRIAEKGMGNDNTEDGDDWSYIGARSAGTNNAETDTQMNDQLTTNGFWWYTNSSSGKAFACNGVVFKITVEEGTFIPTVRYLPHHGLTGDLYAFIIDPAIAQVNSKYDLESDQVNNIYYLLNGDNWKKLTEVQLAASEAMVSKSGVPNYENMTAFSGNPVTLKEGEYYLLIAAGDLNSRYAPYINSFELEKVPSLEIAASATTVEIGNKVTIDTTTDASAITYKSSDDGIAKVEYNATTGIATVTGVSKGTATITASVEGYDVSKSVGIEVTGEMTKYEFTLGAMSTTGTYTNSMTNTTNLHAEKGMGNADWTYVGGHAYTAGKDNYYSQFTPYGFWYYTASSSGSLGNNGIVFEINVPDDGEYITTLNYLPSYAAGTVYACIMDKAIDGRSNGINEFPYDFCDTVNDEVSIAASASYAVTALKTSLTNGTDLRSEITLALSGELQDHNGADVTDSTRVGITADNTIALKKGEYYLLIATDAIQGQYVSPSFGSKLMPYINSFEIEKVGELDEALDAAFAVNKQDDYKYTAPTVDGLTDEGAIAPVPNGDGTYTLTAPEENETGEKFLYWARGLTTQKRIVSFSNVIENYVPTEDGRNFLIAVYDSEGPSKENAEYYNANGQLIAIGDEPTELSMAGYGSFSEWKQYGDKNIWVAEYDNKTQPDNVTVTVNGKDRTVPYGNPVTCTADAADGSGAPFKCWKKTKLDGTSEIVSIDKTYTFKAWETCTVTAEYEKHSFVSVVMKIITDSFDVGTEKGIMAEFVGFDNKVVEKGIMFGDNKIAMTAPGSQFSVIADENGKYKGYAILKNTDGTYSLITGNEITVSNAE